MSCVTRCFMSLKLAILLKSSVQWLNIRQCLELTLYLRVSLSVKTQIGPSHKVPEMNLARYLLSRDIHSTSQLQNHTHLFKGEVLQLLLWDPQVPEHNLLAVWHHPTNHPTLTYKVHFSKMRFPAVLELL